MNISDYQDLLDDGADEVWLGIIISLLEIAGHDVSVEGVRPYWVTEKTRRGL